MQDGIQLFAPEKAQQFLRSFGAGIKRQGEAYVRKGAVHELAIDEPGKAYSALVVDGQENEVSVYYLDEAEAGGDWMGDCSCPREFDCPHVFAVMRELLAEHSATAVRKLSAGAGDTNAQAKPGSPAKPRDLVDRLAAALGRPLKPEEAKFIAKVRNAYAQAKASRQITHWDFDQMGVSLGGYGWEALQIWPSLPENEYEFWLFVANALQKNGGAIPKFMEPISDLQSLQEKLARWERSKQIDQWRQKLGEVETHALALPPDSLAEADLRLVVGTSELRLEWQRPGHEGFEPLKQGHWSQVSSQYQNGQLRLKAEAEWIWQSLGELFNYGTSLRWSYLGAAGSRALSRLLRFKTLESRIVTESGMPLARPSEPLRWDLAPAANQEDDYRLRLVKADGSALTGLRSVLAGSPSLYLTIHAVFTGPIVSPMLKPEGETRIPAPALEVPAGVTLLQRLGLELPPRLKERVRTLGYEVVIECKLDQGPYQAGEDCVISATAKAADGRTLTWAGYNWLDGTSKSDRKRLKNEDTITVYDSKVLAETQIVLESLGVRQDPYRRGFVVRVTKKFPEMFAQWLKSVPPHIGVHLEGELASFIEAEVPGRVKLEVTEAEVDWFDLQVVLDVADTTLSAEEIQLLLKAKGQYVRLEGKGWRRLQFDLSEEENERLAQLGLSARELSAEPQRLHALQLAHDAAKRFLPEVQVERVQRRADEIKARVAPPVPAGITAEMRPYQIEGFHFLAYLAANRFGGVLADDMGLGKTLQTLAWLLWLREQGNGEAAAVQMNGQQAAEAAGAPLAPEANKRPSLVVCPKSVMDNWRAEATRFAPGLRVRVWSPGDLDGFFNELDQADLHVLNYSQLRTLGESVSSTRWLSVILDEGQYIKNPNSQTAQVARALRAEYRLVLSGTPIENRLLDLWSLMTFAMPGVLGSRAHFGRIYDAKGDPFARRRLASRVRPFLLRRTKGQVAKDLPDRVEEDLFCELEGEQKTLYRAELKRAQQLLLAIKTQKELAQQQFHFLVSLLRLRQICCDPRLRDPESKAPSAKTEALLEQLEPLMEEGQKVLVFSQFVELLALLRPALAERKWPTFYLAGETENRGKVVEEFQTAEGPAVFLISLKAGGFGLNLTAASYVVLFDPWWNPAVENQAIDRTHRIGQTNKVMAYRLLIKNSIEEKIRQLQKTKQALAQDVLGEERFAQKLTLDDLKFLFAD